MLNIVIFKIYSKGKVADKNKLNVKLIIKLTGNSTKIVVPEYRLRVCSLREIYIPNFPNIIPVTIETINKRNVLIYRKHNTYIIHLMY